MCTCVCHRMFPAQENKPTVTGMSALEAFVIKMWLCAKLMPKKAQFEKSPRLYTETYFQKGLLSIVF